MKIGIDSRAAALYRGTGIGNYTYQLIKNFNKIDSQNDYFVLAPPNTSFELDLNHNFNIVNASISNKKNFWQNISNYNLIKKNDFDIYHVPQNGIGLSPNTPCNSIITLHDIIPLKMPETVSPILLKIFSEEIPKIISKTNAIITVSNFSKNDICKELNYPENKVFVTHLAAEDIYKPLDNYMCRKILKYKYNINDNFILYVGGFSPRKNIIGLIESFSLFKNMKKNSTKLVIIGSHGISYEKYKQRAYELNIDDSILFPGFIPLEHMPLFYNAAIMLVYPSFYEGFGLPPLESMACGTPVIASNVTSMPEVLQDCALLINPFDINELTDSITRLHEDFLLRSSLIEKGLKHSNKFNWKKTTIKTLKYYIKASNPH
ncbi:glycosyltransferase family 4 protein [Clostridium tarantellae]|uniref:Glycosyltransferase n=1 Tax=Clostridium tarantellae TaxID=39493 RepID=A0A6I1MHW9_9CLOT|nr:glycosyltransferase family 1 protein [Clostridium tarantellae]MPQ43005.1 glycosyltransferase [Clostridium tarantellae]